ncbi:MAG: ABC transporter permease [Actinomycetota bacterium]|nr:ABC transporter permease [Actinomycetota bacterium]
MRTEAAVRLDVLADTAALLVRQVRNLVRQRVFVVLLVVQPLFWLVLYGELFERVTTAPGFGADSYTQFLIPGVAIMTAFMDAVWSGMSMVEDVDRGIIERFLASSVTRGAIVAGHILRAGLIAAMQAAVILVVGIALGGSVHGGAPGWAVVLVAAFLVAAIFAGISSGIALLTRRQEPMAAMTNFVALPLVFFSSALISVPLMPEWMRSVARFNPVEWGVVCAREVVEQGAEWGRVAAYLALMAAASLATWAFATACFRVYRRSF